MPPKVAARICIPVCCACIAAIWVLAHNHDHPNFSAIQNDALMHTNGSIAYQYAIATIVLTQSYQDTAMALCMSIRLSFAEGDLPSDVDLVAYVPENAYERSIDPSLLRCCFSRIHTLPLIHVSRPPSFERFKEQYIKLNLWRQTEYRRMVYMDADFVVVRVQALLDLLRDAPIAFGAVQDWNQGQWSDHWNGGLFLLEPSNDTFDALLSNLEPFIQQQRFNTEIAEQGYLSAYFDHLGFTLPTTFNLNLAIKYQAPDVWNRYADEAIAIHFTWVKPWEHPEDRQSFPASMWWASREHAKVLCKE